ncbi:hypothetical protein JB92DRAFT_3099977 [Gautieria morchelliformis]|nr:hypothetical protein JB92DRAFT_3099977 [Gautieria morchelliformis]
MTKTGDSAFFYPNKSSNSARNLFAINYCRDHPKTTKGDFENAWKIVEGDPEKKAFYVKLSLHNKARRHPLSAKLARVVQWVGSVENGESAGIGEEAESAGVGAQLYCQIKNIMKLI